MSHLTLICGYFEETKYFLPVAGSCPRLMNPLAVTSLSPSFALPPCFLLLSHSVSFPLFPPYFPCSPLLSRLLIGLFPLFLLKVKFCLPAPPSGKVPQIKSKRPSLNTRICSTLLYTVKHVKGCLLRTAGPMGRGGDRCRKHGVNILSSTIFCLVTRILGILHQNHVLFI